MGGEVTVFQWFIRDWQARVTMLIVGGMLLAVSILSIRRLINVLVVSGYTDTSDIMVLGLLAVVGLLGVGCIVSSLVFSSDKSEGRIDGEGNKRQQG